MHLQYLHLKKEHVSLLYHISFSKLFQRSKTCRVFFAGWWFQPIWKMCSSNWIISPGRGENNTYLKPPPSLVRPGQNKTYQKNHLLRRKSRFCTGWSHRHHLRSLGAVNRFFFWESEKQKHRSTSSFTKKRGSIDPLIEVGHFWGLDSVLFNSNKGPRGDVSLWKKQQQKTWHLCGE